MIVVRVELHSAITRQVTELARAHICNIGGSGTVRDYEIRTLRGRSTRALDAGAVQRHGKVLGHRSLDLHIWHLVGKALQRIGYTPPPAADAGEIDRLRKILRDIACQNDPAWAQQLARDEVGSQEVAEA